MIDLPCQMLNLECKPEPPSGNIQMRYNPNSTHQNLFFSPTISIFKTRLIPEKIRQKFPKPDSISGHRRTNLTLHKHFHSLNGTLAWTNQRSDRTLDLKRSFSGFSTVLQRSFNGHSECSRAGKTRMQNTFKPNPERAGQ